MQLQAPMVFYTGGVYYFSKGYPTRGFQPTANFCVGYTFGDY
jgi:hypothetical protein